MRKHIMWMKWSGPQLVFILILLFGLFLRLYNTSLALNVDEPNVIKRAVQIADGEWHIRWYNWPAQSLMRLNAGVFWIAHEISGMRNADQDSTVSTAYALNPDFFTLIGHVVTTVFGVLTLFFVYRIGALLRSPWAGVLSAGFLSIGYLHVLHSHFATPDVPVTALVMANLWIALVLLKGKGQGSRNTRWLVFLSGLIAGFAIATKYTGILAVVPVGIVVLYQMLLSWKKNPRAAFLTWLQLVGLCLAGLVIMHTLANPYAWVDRAQIVRSIVFESNTPRIGFDWGGNGGVVKNLTYYVNGLLGWSGSFITLIAYATMIYALFHWKQKRWNAFLLVPCQFMVTLAALSVLTLHWSRWAIPLTPLIAVAAGIGVYELIRGMRHRYSLRWSIVFATLMILCITLPQALLSITRGYHFGLESTHDRIASAIQTAVPSGSRIAADTYFIPSQEDRSVTQYQIHLYKKLPREYKERGFTHVIVKRSRQSYAKKQPEQYQHFLAFFEELNQHGTLITTIGPTGDPILKRKRDWHVYYWLWRNRNTPDAFRQTITKQRFDLYAL